VYWCIVAVVGTEVQAFIADCPDVAVTGPGLGSMSMQIVRDARINKATDINRGNLYDDPLIALVELVEPYNITRGLKEPMQILHEAMSVPIVMKSIAGKIGSVGRSTVEIQNDCNF